MPPKSREWVFYEVRDGSNKLRFASIYLEGPGSAIDFCERHYHKTKKRDGVGTILNVKTAKGKQSV